MTLRQAVRRSRTRSAVLREPGGLDPHGIVFDTYYVYRARDAWIVYCGGVKTGTLKEHDPKDRRFFLTSTAWEPRDPIHPLEELATLG